jgi:hypothetical protein
MKALPIPPRKVTALLPLPEQPAHVKIPEVEKVMGAALASAVPSAATATRSATVVDDFKGESPFRLPVAFSKPPCT